MKRIKVTRADRDIARAAVELDKRLGREPDPRMVALANATTTPTVVRTGRRTTPTEPSSARPSA